MLIVPDVPVIELLTVSVAVIVRAVVDVGVAENVPVPPLNVELPGTVPAALILKCTVPE
jgi:hypothetical protein